MKRLLTQCVAPTSGRKFHRRPRRLAVGLFWVALVVILTACEKIVDPKSPTPSAPSADALVKESSKGPVRVRASVSPSAPRLSDMVELKLEIAAEQGVEVKPPLFGQSVGEFIIRDYREAVARVEDGRTVRTFVYELEPLISGRHLLHSSGVTFVDRRAGSEAKDQTMLVESEPIEIEVSSMLGDEKPDLADLEPMEEPLPLAPRPWPAWIWAAIGCGGGLLLLVLVLVLRKKRILGTPQRVLTAEEIALAELQVLMQERLPEKGLIVDFYVRLTGTVRRYIEHQTGIHAPEQTTEEFLREIKLDPRFERERAVLLGRFLETSDLVKYAAQRPEAQDIQKAFDCAQAFVGLGGSSNLPLQTRTSTATMARDVNGT